MDLSTCYCRDRHCRRHGQSESGAQLELAGWHRGQIPSHISLWQADGLLHIARRQEAIAAYIAIVVSILFLELPGHSNPSKQEYNSRVRVG